MLVCSFCPNEFNRGFVCNKCSKLHCHEHHFSSCPFCGGSLEELSVRNEKFDHMTVQWLIVKQLEQVGVSELDHLPSYTISVSQELSSSSHLKPILFASKADSMKLEGIIRKRHGQAVTDMRPVSEKSRYTILSFERTGPKYLLLNTGAIEKSDIIFLIQLLSRLAEKAKESHDIFEKHSEFLDALVKTFFSYARKMEIPFVYADEMTAKLINVMAENIKLNYLECLVIRELADAGFINDLTEYLVYKIKLNLEAFDYEMRFQLIEVYHVLDKMLNTAILLSSISDHKPLHNYVANIFNEDLERFKVRYFELPDLLRAVDYILASENRITFISYEEYVNGIREIIGGAFHEIQARYVSLGEGIALVKLSEFYLNALDNDTYVFEENIGSIHGYIKLLRKVFDKKGIYPEVRILAGLALTNTLHTWLMMDHDFSRFLELVESTKELCKLIVASLPEIMKKNGTISGFVGSPISYEDAASSVLSASRMARSYGDLKIEKELFQIAEQIAVEYDLPSVKFHLWWTKFVSFQDFRYLPKIHEIVGRIDFKRFPFLENTVLSIDLLIQALIYREDITSKLAKAQDLILNDVVKTTGQRAHIIQSIQHSEALYHVFEMFKCLLLSSKTPNMAKEAYIASLTLERILAKTDPLNAFATNTQLLYKLLISDFPEASTLHKKLSNYADPKNKIRTYLQYAKNWIEVCDKQDERRYIYQKEFHYDGDDVWTQTLHSHIQKTMEEDLSRNISGSTAIVFVEGDTDELILKEFADKLYPHNKISFLDIEGHTNYSSYVEAKTTRELKIPTYLIFDGDTRTKRKQQLASQFDRLSIRGGHIYTLKRNSIEDYILNPEAIKQAFPNMKLSIQQIREFLKKSKNKKNKKVVLSALFKQGHMGSYNKTIAHSIAGNIQKAEIEAELVQLLRKIYFLEDDLSE